MLKNIITISLAAIAVSMPFEGSAALTLEQARELDQKIPLGFRPNYIKLTPNRKTVAARRGKAAPVKRVSPNGMEIYGYMSYADVYDFSPQMCVLEGDEFVSIWSDPRYDADGAIMHTGWLRGTKLCGVANFSIMGYELARYNVECDLASGATLVYEELPEGTPSFNIAAYDISDGYLYGIYGSGKDYFWGKAPVDKPNEITEIKRADMPLQIISITYRQDEKAIYGVNTSGEFLRISHAGDVTVLKNLSLPGNIAAYFTGLIYSSADGVFYWNVNYDDYTADLFAIDGNSYELKLVDECPDSQQYNFFLSHDETFNPGAPGRCVFSSIDFPKGSLSGKITATLPVKTLGGMDISGILRYTALVDNEVYSEGQGASGSAVTVEVGNLTEGFHSFGFYATDAEGTRSPIELKAQFIGQDVPMRPAKVVLEGKNLSWDPVTLGVNGGYVDAESMKYHICNDNGDEVLETSETSCEVPIPEGEPINSYSFSVAAEYENLWSDPRWSNYEIYGEPLDLPLDFAPTREQSRIFTVDAVDGYWNYDSAQEVFLSVAPAEGKRKGWLFTPPFRITDTSVYYTLNYQARLTSTDNVDETLRVYVGKENLPEAMKPVGEAVSPDRGFKLYDNLVGVDEPGTYYIGFYCESEEGKSNLALKSISLVNGGVTPKSPARVEDLEAYGGEQGALKARIEFTFPTHDMSGNHIPADAELNAIVTGKSKAVATGNPGKKAYVSVSTEQGDNTVSVVVSLDGANSPVAYVDVYTGVVRPAKVGAISYLPSEDMMSVRMTWPKVTRGEGNGYIDASDISYKLYRKMISGGVSRWTLVGEDIFDCDYTYTLPAGEPQALLQLGLAAVNAAGESKDLSLVSLVAGTPYTLPMQENFADCGEEGSAFAPYMNYKLGSAYTATWEFVAPEILGSDYADEPGFYFVATGEKGAKARLGLPCFSTIGGGAKVTLTGLCGGDFSSFSIYADNVSLNSPKLVGMMPEEGGLVSKTITLPKEFDNRGWVQLYLDGTLQFTGSFMALRGFDITSVSGIGNTRETALCITSGTGFITVCGAEGEDILITSADGRIMTRAVDTPSEVRFDLASGIYVVKVGSEVTKVLVR